MYSRSFVGIFGAVLCLNCNAGAVLAQAKSSSNEGKEPSNNALQKKTNRAPEVAGGIVINLTTTGFGRQFYERFVSLWQDNPLNEQYAIAIRERASARYGSQIFVEYEQRRVFQTFLSPNSNAIRTVSENAVAVVFENIMATDVQKMFRDADLAVDEI